MDRTRDETEDAGGEVDPVVDGGQSVVSRELRVENERLGPQISQMDADGLRLPATATRGRRVPRLLWVDMMIPIPMVQEGPLPLMGMLALRDPRCEV